MKTSTIGKGSNVTTNRLTRIGKTTNLFGPHLNKASDGVSSYRNGVLNEVLKEIGKVYYSRGYQAVEYQEILEAVNRLKI